MRFHSRLNLGVWFLAIAGIPALLRGQTSAPSLGAAASFAVLGGSRVTNSGSTIITGNLGVSPGNTITGSPTVKVGATFRNDSTAREAQQDATAAYNDLAARPCGVDLTGQDLGGRTLGSGVYCFSSSAQLTGTLTLNAAGNSAAVWIFQMASTFTTAADSRVLAINGAQAGKVFWQVGNSASLGANSTLLGSIFALTSITLNNGASVSGRLLARAGDVTLDTNDVSLCCDPLTVDPPTLPGGTVCTPYSNVPFSASGGTAPYSFSVTTGALPDGLVLIGGVLSGTPSKTGTFSVAVTATDSHGCSGTRVYAIEIGCPADDLPIPLPPAKACDAYCQKITRSCGTGPLTSGDLPAGLTLSPDGMLCGTPTTPGDYVFTVADQTSGCSRRYAVQVVCNVMISPAVLPSGAACIPYCQTLTASCGTPPYTFSVPPGTLPAGLLLSPGGMLCGTPATPGSSTFVVTATDAKGCTGSRTYTVPVVCNVTVSPATLPDGVVGTPYPNETITGSCGTAPYTCSVTGALPPGLTLVGCTISGTPTTAGCSTFKVTDANGCSTVIIYTVCVKPCAILISPSMLPDASVCVPYSQTITPNCAVAPYTCSVTDGTLPSGLVLANCTISGTPTTAGSSMFTVTAKDAAANSASQNYTLLVTAGVVLTPATLPDGWPGVPYSEVITASGGTAPYTFVVSGTLPPGLAPSSTQTTLTISGTPTTVGCFPFTVTVTDANGCSTSITYTICIATGGPTLSVWGMVVLSIVLVGVGFVMIRRGGAL